DSGDEALGLDRAEDRPRLGIDLIDLPVPVLPHPQRSFGPGHPRVTAAAGGRDRGQHSAALGIDLLDAISAELEQMPAVEGGPRVRGDLDRSPGPPARGVEGDQTVARAEPDLSAV